jgi:sporulation related protein/tetratricopeptide repeat protein
VSRALRLGAIVALAVAPRLAAQAAFTPRLQAAIVLAQSGRADSARALVRALLSSLSPQDSIYPQALYVQGGMLASDASVAATSLQRVVVEYGTSPWADDALLRLAQLYEAQNDPASAVQWVDRLRRDYPDSPLLPKADFVAARAAFDLRDESRGCTFLHDAQSAAGDDVEFRNQVAFYAARCPTAAAVSPATSESAGRHGSRYAVQVLAGKSAPQIDEMLSRLKALRYSAYVVRDTTGYLKVRVGPYPSHDAAQRVQALLKTRLGGQPFVVEEP